MMQPELTLKEKTLRYVASFLSEGYSVLSLVSIPPNCVAVLRHSHNGNFIKVVTSEKYAYVYKRSQHCLYSAYKLLKREAWK